MVTSTSPTSTMSALTRLSPTPRVPSSPATPTPVRFCGVKRNLTDDQFRTIRDMGGIVGLNYCSEFLSNDATDKTAADVTFDQLAAHIEHWLDTGGEDVIALGGGLGPGAAVPTFLSDASKMPEFQNMLSSIFSKTVMQKLCSDNALAFFERY